MGLKWQSHLGGSTAPVRLPLSNRAERRLVRLPLYSETDYLTLHPDVARTGVKASEHALLHASREGRAVFLQSAIARVTGTAALALSNMAQFDEVAQPDNRAGFFSVFVHSDSCLKHQDLASSLCNDFISSGSDCELLDETADYLQDHGTCIFVAPHEFFFMGRGQLWQNEAIIDDSFMLNTETIWSKSGVRALPIILSARGVLDISAASDWVWRAAQMPSFHYAARVKVRDTWLRSSDMNHPLVLAMPVIARKPSCNVLDWQNRPIDLSFFADFNARRSAFFGQSAPVFANFKSFIYLQQGSTGFDADPVHERIIGHLSSKTRITLHISEDGIPTFDRMRVVHNALAGGSVLVSDVQFPDVYCQSGVHYFQDDFKHIPMLVEWLINDVEGRMKADAVRRAARDLIRETNRDSARPKRLVAFLLAAEPERA